MAVVSRNANTDNKDKKQPKEFAVTNPFDTNLKEGTKNKIDPTEDAWSRSAPPPMGYYDLKLFLDKDGYVGQETDKGQVFYRAGLECKIVSPANGDVDNFTVFAKVSTYLGRGKQISTMAGLYLLMGGKKITGVTELSDKEVLQLFAKKLQSEPIIRKVFCDWNGWSKKNETSVFSSMTDFPEDEESGGHSHIVKITAKDGTSETITASLKVRGWPDVTQYLAGQWNPVQANGTEGAGAGKKVVQAGDDDDGPATPAAAPQVAQAQAPQPVAAAPAAQAVPPQAAQPVRKKKPQQAPAQAPVVPATPPPPPLPVAAKDDEDEGEGEDVDLSEFEGDDED